MPNVANMRVKLSNPVGWVNSHPKVALGHVCAIGMPEDGFKPNAAEAGVAVDV